MLAEFRLHNTDCHAHYRYGIRKVYGAVTVDIGKRQGLFGNVSQIKRVAHDCDCIRNGNSAVTVNIAHDTVCSVNSGYGAVGGYVLIGSFPMAEGVALMHGRSGQIRRAAFGNGNFGNDAAVNTVNESDRVILSVIYRLDLYVVNINAVVIFIAHIVFFIFPANSVII